MQEASEAQDFERAALFRDRLNAVRSMMERQQVAGGSLGSADVIGGGGRGQRRERAGLPGPRRCARRAAGLLPGGRGRRARRGRSRPRRGRRDLPAPVLRGRACGARPGDRRARAAGPHRRARRGARRASATRRWRSGWPRAATCAGCASSPRRTRSSPSPRTSCAASTAASSGSRSLSALQEALGLERVPVRIEGFDISNLGETHTVASMVVFEGGAPKKSDYRKFGIRGEFGENGGGPDDFAAMQEVLSRRLGRYLQQADISPHDSDRDASFAALPGPDRDRRRQGPALGRDEGARAAHRARASRWSAWPSGSRRSSSPAARSRSGCEKGSDALRDAAAGARRGAPVRDHLPPQPPRPRR